MPLHGSTIWKRRHSSKTRPVIHKANISRLFYLLESWNPAASPDSDLVVEKFVPPSSNAHIPAWSPITARAPIPASWPGTSTSNKAPLWLPATPPAPPLAAPPANHSAQWLSFMSPPAAALPLTELAALPGTVPNGKAPLQQMLVRVYGEAAFTLLSLADWEKHMCVPLPFEELPVHPALANSPRVPGLRALGLDVLYEVGQMDFFTWRIQLFGPDYA